MRRFWILIAALLVAAPVSAQQIVPGVNFFRVVDGTAARPSDGFIQDPDTGTYRVAANTWGVTTGGTLRVSVSSTAVTSAVPVLGPDGAVGSPAFAFSADSNTGFYRTGSGQISMALDGVFTHQFAAEYFQIAGTNAALYMNDVLLSRGAANRLDLATGDSFYLVSGGLGVGTTPVSAGAINSSGTITAGNGIFYFGVGGGDSRLQQTAASKFIFANGTDTLGVGFDLTTDAILAFRNRAQTGGASLNLLEQTAPAAPAANQVTIYAVDNGAGKTQLMALFSSGASQQLAIQP